MSTGVRGILKRRVDINMKKEPQIFTVIDAQDVPVSNNILDALEQEEIREGIIRQFVKELLTEQEVKFSGILKIMPSSAIAGQAEQIIKTLPAETEIPWWDELDVSNLGATCRIGLDGKAVCETISLPSDKFHVTLVHQSLLKPYRKQLQALDKAGLFPAPPAIQLDPSWEERTDLVAQRRSFVAWVENQSEVGEYLNEIMKLVGGPMNIWTQETPVRKFHVSLANLTGNPGDSVK